MKVEKTFWVSDIELEKLNKKKDISIVLRHRDESNYKGIENRAVNKITITYEADQEITLKESEARKVLKEEIISHGTINNIMRKLFGESNE